VRIGFTGTRNGMTAKQLRNVKALLHHYNRGALWFHHGDCVGADAEAHALAYDLGYWIKIHPPTNSEHQAHCFGTEEALPQPYMKRNKEIVAEVNVMIAAPPTDEELDHGGTWRTIGLARKAKRHLFVCLPNGEVKEENADS
jgi:hypothetical protein